MPLLYSLTVGSNKQKHSPIRTYTIYKLFVAYMKTQLNIHFLRNNTYQKFTRVERAIERIATLFTFASGSHGNAYRTNTRPLESCKARDPPIHFEASDERGRLYRRGWNYDALRSGRAGFARNFEGHAAEVRPTTAESLALELARSSHSRGTSVT